MLVACNKHRFTEVFLRYESPAMSSHVFGIENVLSEASRAGRNFKNGAYSDNKGYSLSVANKCYDAELERSVKHSIYVLMDYEPSTGVLFVERFTTPSKPMVEI